MLYQIDNETKRIPAITEHKPVKRMNEDKVIKNTPPVLELVFLTTTNINLRHPPQEFLTREALSPPSDIPIHIVLTFVFKKNVTPCISSQ